jgi:hypothetical protein
MCMALEATQKNPGVRRLAPECPPLQELSLPATGPERGGTPTVPGIQPLPFWTLPAPALAHLKGQLKRYFTSFWRISSHFCSSRLCLRELRLV